MIAPDERAADELDSVPISAVVLHGRGQEGLQLFQNYCAAHAFSQLQVVAGVIRRWGIDDEIAAQTHAVLEALLAEPLDQLVTILGSMSFRAWFGQLEAALVHDHDRVTGVRLLAQLPYLVVRPLLARGADRSFRVSLPSRRCVSPTGHPFALTWPGSSSGWAQMQVAGGRAIIEADGCGRVVLESDASSTSVPAPADGVNVHRRRFSVSGVELFSLEDFPELMPFNARKDEVAPSRASEVDRHLAAAFEVLLQVWPEAIPDIVLGLRGIVALEAPNGTTFSASTPNVPGLVLLTIRPDECAEVLAECIVHEIAHVKLDMLWSLHSLLDNDGSALYRHPWRQDLRPMRGVLLGAHAFLNVCELNRRGLALGNRAFFELETPKRFGEVRAALAVLDADARFTALGARIYAGMKEVVRTWPEH